MTDTPDSKYIPLTDAQVKKALASVFKCTIREAYDIESYCLTSTGKFLVKLTKRPAVIP